LSGHGDRGGANRACGRRIALMRAGTVVAPSALAAGRRSNPSGVAFAQPSTDAEQEIKMNTRKTLIAVAVAALIPMGAALADDYGSKDHDKAMSGTSFKKLDTNKDGRISQAEAAADSTIVFSSADTNGDGYLDKGELKAASSGSGNTNRQQSVPSSQSPESSSPTSPGTSSETDPNQPQGTQPSGNGTRSPDTENPRQ
jgi:hypothetical protein